MIFHVFNCSAVAALRFWLYMITNSSITINLFSSLTLYGLIHSLVAVWTSHLTAIGFAVLLTAEAICSSCMQQAMGHRPEAKIASPIGRVVRNPNQDQKAVGHREESIYSLLQTAQVRVIAPTTNL
jgi:hypothetical protein